MISDPRYQCGIHYLLATDERDPFHAACVEHDRAFELREQGQQEKSRSEVDREFLDQMLAIAGGHPYLKARAYVYYAIVRSLGWVWW